MRSVSLAMLVLGQIQQHERAGRLSIDLEVVVNAVPGVRRLMPAPEAVWLRRIDSEGIRLFEKELRVNSWVRLFGVV